MERFSFENPQWLFLLWLIPILIGVIVVSWRSFFRFQRGLDSRPYLYQGQLPPWWRRSTKALFYCLGLALLVGALADPHYQKVAPENVYKQIRVYFIFDISQSMKMVEDIKPNRLAAAKEEIKKAYQEVGGTYEAAIVPFSGVASAYYQPPTFDSFNFLTSLEQLDVSTIPVPGTDLVRAFQALNQLVQEFGLRDETVNLAVILSDGGKEIEGVIDQAALKKEIAILVRSRFRLYAFGIGGVQSSPLVIRDSGGNFINYLRDQGGRVYTSQLDEVTLKFIAKTGEGYYLRFEKEGQLKEALKEIIRESGQQAQNKPVYQKTSIRLWFFLAALTIFISGETYFHFRK